MTNELCPHCQLPRQGAHSCMDSMRAEIAKLNALLAEPNYCARCGVNENEPLPCATRESDWCCTHCGRDNDPTESHCVHCEWSRKHTVAGVLHERGCEDNPCRCGALKSPGASRDVSSQGVQLPPMPVSGVLEAVIISGKRYDVNTEGTFRTEPLVCKFDDTCQKQNRVSMMCWPCQAKWHRAKADEIESAVHAQRTGE